MEDNSIKSRVVGVDISSEQTSIAVVDVRGNILAEENFKTMDYPDVNDFAARLSETIVKLVEENGGYEIFRSIGISCPSASSTSGCIVNAPNLPWKGVVPLTAMLRDRIGLAVGVANDCHISALGEKEYGCAHGMKNFILVNLGVGVGSCFFSTGHEHYGFSGYAGEFGHTCIVDHGRRCGCGQEGCVEAYVGAKGIVRTAQELLAEDDSPSLLRTVQELSPKTIAQCCEQGDAIAIETYRRTGYLLGLGLANYASIVSPEAVILSGGVSKAGRWLLAPLRQSFEEHVFNNLQDKVKILVSELNDRERDVLGASVLAWDVPEYSLFK